MAYFKLLIPIPIVFLLSLTLIPIPQDYPFDYNLVLATAIKGGLLVYYFRLGNSRTPLVNVLTIMLLGVMLAEYLSNKNYEYAQTMYIGANIALGLTFAFRQRLKNRIDPLAWLKVFSLLAYCLSSILYVNKITNFVPLIIATIFLITVYLYDRLMKIGV